MTWAAFVRLYAVCLRSFLLQKETARVEAEVRELRGALKEGGGEAGEDGAGAAGEEKEEADEEEEDVELSSRTGQRAKAKLRFETRRLERDVRAMRERVEAQRKHAAALRVATRKGTAEAETKLREREDEEKEKGGRRGEEKEEEEEKKQQQPKSLKEAFRRFDLYGYGGGDVDVDVDDIRISARDLFDCLALVRGDAMSGAGAGESTRRE